MKFLLSLLSGFILSVTLGATGYDMPQSIAAIVENLGIDIPVGGTFHCNTVPGNPVLYSVAENGVIIQIGVRIFSDTVKSSIEPGVCDCIERTWLEMLLCSELGGQKKILNMKRMGMTVDGFPLGDRRFPSLDTAAEIIKKSGKMDLDVQNGTISLSFTGTENRNFRIIVPADVTVVFPFDKKEHEEYLYSKLTGSSVDFHPERLMTPSVFSEENGYLVSGGLYYMIDSLSNNVYFKKEEMEYKVVFDSLDPVTSFRNIVMGAVPENLFEGIDIDIHFRSYNPELGNLTLPLSKLLGYMKSIGMEFFSGNMSSLGKNRVLLVFHHPVYQYIDMLTVEIPEGCGFPSQCILPAELVAFIPQNNIKNLFGK